MPKKSKVNFNPRARFVSIVKPNFLAPICCTVTGCSKAIFPADQQTGKICPCRNRTIMVEQAESP